MGIERGSECGQEGVVMDNDEIRALRALAEAVGDSWSWGRQCQHWPGQTACDWCRDAESRYIATCSPDRIVALCDELLATKHIHQWVELRRTEASLLMWCPTCQATEQYDF